MANPKPKYQFPKGHKFGRGRLPLTPDVKAARKFNQNEFELAVAKILFLSAKDLQRLVGAPGTTVIEAIIGRIILTGIQKGTTHELNYFVERFFGKVAENHNFTGNANPDLVNYIERVNREHSEREATHEKSKNSNDKKITLESKEHEEVDYDREEEI